MLPRWTSRNGHNKPEVPWLRPAAIMVIVVLGFRRLSCLGCSRKMGANMSPNSRSSSREIGRRSRTPSLLLFALGEKSTGRRRAKGYLRDQLEKSAKAQREAEEAAEEPKAGDGEADAAGPDHPEV